MYHRLRLIDLIIALEVGVRARRHLNLVRTFVEYRRVKRITSAKSRNRLLTKAKVSLV